MRTLDAILRRAGALHADRTALVVPGRRFSYRELLSLAGRAAAGLKRLGIREGDVVSVYSGNAWEWVVSYYGIALAGGVANPVNTMFTAEEVRYVTADCRARAVLASSDKAAALAGLPGTGTVEQVILYEGGAGFLDFRSLLEAPPQDGEPPPDPGADGVIAYTSGTTGHPKGAVLSKGAVALNGALTATAHVRTERDVVVTSLPAAHVYGMAVMNATFLSGGTLVLLPRFEEEAVLAAIERERATIFEGVPTMYLYLLAHPGLGRRDLSSLTRCTVGGQTMPKARMEEFERRAGCPLLELWGMTEIAGLGTTHPLYAGPRHGSIGVPLPFVQARVASLEDPARDAPPGEEGELLVRGPIVMKGYFGNASATRETIEPSGWLHTGDIARADGEGYLYVVDRKKDMIITGGFKVYPAEIERVLSGHPKVAMVAVGGVADPVKGELARAYVVLKPGEGASEEELVAYCRERLAAYKVPRSVAFVRELPRTSTGKVMRRRLQEAAAPAGVLHPPARPV